MYKIVKKRFWFLLSVMLFEVAGTAQAIPSERLVIKGD